ncbi:MAG TPA: thiamine-phosphate kinase [Planctomycetaceae bacterium]|nr:thiamine-phosphate kinase [Planctomycetaceae bacterium]
MTENEFLQSLAQRFPARNPVLHGIGDDGAVLQAEPHGRVVVVTDMLLDGTHFRLSEITPALAGRKALAVNLSDLAAMLAKPTAAFISLAIPRATTDSTAFLQSLYHGLQELADEFHCVIAGGDTNSWDGPFAINVALTGSPLSTSIPLRSGARPGDLLFVTGPLGGSLASGRHLTFRPRLDIARWLADSVSVSALMDISDGLATDLPRMMQASGTSARLTAADIPIHSDVPPDLPPALRLQAALSDGEDFELLLAVPPAAATALQAAPEGLAFQQIGSVEAGQGITLLMPDGQSSRLPAGGWQHRL